MDDTGITTTNATFAFSYKTLGDHLHDFLRRPLPILVFAVAIFGVLWTFGEAAIQLTDANPRGWFSYGLLIAASVIASLMWNGYLYLHRVPEGLDDVSPHAQRIAHLQRPRWEFRYAKSVLAQLLGPIDRECRDLLDGKVSVLAERPRDFREYVSWLQGRPDNMLRMLEIANQLMLIDLPKALTSTKDKPASPKNILDVSLAIQRFYQETVNCERSSLAILPPEECQRLHQLQVGWSQPIRDAILQLFDYLQQICELDYRKNSYLQYTIEFGECPNIDEFCTELNRLETRLPQIMENEW